MEMDRDTAAALYDVYERALTAQLRPEPVLGVADTVLDAEEMQAMANVSEAQVARIGQAVVGAAAARANEG
ncbi:MAG TPA: hypothetical protein VLA61_18410 [Ideonella sp.]|uniref:hypothetical protein n=1 Tax=Ideonella sp. TaxID=1929293 RepID=UPI002D066D7E|nr:hypothetical protein [Ideonella sp.]HSI50249.1 hypothetical protein [Ideonella sp.]